MSWIRATRGKQPAYCKRQFGKCVDCARRFQIFFVGQTRCHPCAAERKRQARARVQPDLPLEGDGRGG